MSAAQLSENGRHRKTCQALGVITEEGVGD